MPCSHKISTDCMLIFQFGLGDYSNSQFLAPSKFLQDVWWYSVWIGWFFQLTIPCSLKISTGCRLTFSLDWVTILAHKSLLPQNFQWVCWHAVWIEWLFKLTILCSQKFLQDVCWHSVWIEWLSQLTFPCSLKISTDCMLIFSFNWVTSPAHNSLLP